jgi:glycosyltransferase involved in cell wall biosynthesis
MAPHSVALATALAQQAEVLLLIDGDELRRDSPDAERQAFADAGRLVTFRQGRLSRLAACASILANVRRFRPDVLIAHEHPKMLVCWMLRRIARTCKILLIVHDPFPHKGREAVQSRRYWRWRDVGRRAASAFLLHGPFCTAIFNRTWDPQGRPVLTSPLGPNLRPAGGEELAAEPGRILMFGRMEAYKGLDLLLEAARILKQRGVEFHLRLAGRGPTLEPLRADYLELGCCSIRSDFLPREAAIEEFRRASVVVVPYTEATQSGIVAIAFAFARPVVATAVGGLPDFVRNEQNGLLVPPDDPGALADALERALTDHTLSASLSAGARRTAETVMSWDRVADVIMHGVAVICSQQLV